MDETILDVIDDASDDETSAPQSYNLSTYGADFEVASLVAKMRERQILVPPFQRGFVWSIGDASRLIESLLLGLPVPGIFLAQEPDSRQLLVIDGQQRLRTLQFFYDGIFAPKIDHKAPRPFKLVHVQPRLEGKSYDELDEIDKVRLDGSLIHATIIQSESAAENDTSVLHVFERLNTGGVKLTPQEIRGAVYHGELIDLLDELNQHPAWRKIFGKESLRLKDRELILRFLALLFEGNDYEKPMNEFASRFNKRHRQLPGAERELFQRAFNTTISAIELAIGPLAFRPERVLNAAVFDAVMVGLARRLANRPDLDPAVLKAAYDNLLSNPEFRAATSTATSDTANVMRRLQLATDTFATI